MGLPDTLMNCLGVSVPILEPEPPARITTAVFEDILMGYFKKIKVKITSNY
jgi:hypothetical protein